MSRANPAPAEGLEVNETKDGVIVYDPEHDRIHYLNATAAVVFVLCDGRRDARGIADALARVYGVDQAPVAEVESCLKQLRDEGLVR